MADVNITKYLSGVNFFKNVKLPTINLKDTKNIAQNSAFKSPNMNATQIATTSIIPVGLSSSVIFKILTYLLVIFIAIIIILLFVHFFITPIFKLKPGDPGIISLPISDNGKLFWTSNINGEIKDKDTPISSISYNYSMIMDIFIDNPFQFSKYPRVIFSRGGLLKENPTAETLLGMYVHYNIVAALTQDTNDIIISVLNKNNNMENIVITNVPVQMPFRLGIILMENALEVYINNKLHKTRAFNAPPMHVTGDILPPQGANTDIAKIRNLKIWPRILTPSEIRYASPSIAKIADFGVTSSTITSPTSDTCSSSIEKTIGDKISSAQSIMAQLPSNISSEINKII